jgi:flagellar basal-body rod protein FlgC
MSLFSALSISASGMAAQRTRAELLTENLANAETTRTPDGGPYRRKDVVFQTEGASSPFASAFSAAMGSEPAGVAVSEIVTDQGDPDQRYLPDHPDAGPDGYVAFPRINPAEEMVNLMSASRSYQANVASMSAVKDMIVHSIDLLR